MKENNKIKEALHKNVPAWEDEMVWEQIEKQLPKEKKNRKLIWFFFIAGLMMSSLYLISNYSTSSIMTASSKVSESSNANASVSSEKASLKTKQHSNTTVAESVESKKNAETQTQTINNKLSNEIEAKKEQAELKFQQDPTVVKNNMLEPSKHTFAESKKKQAKHNNQQLTTNIKQPNHNIQQLTTNIHQPNALPFLKIGIVLDKKTKINTLSILTESSSKVDLKSARVNKLKFSVGISNTFRDLSSKIEDDWVKQKEAIETVMESSDFQLSYERKIYKNILASVGLGFRQSIEISDYRDSTVQVKDVFVDTALVVTNSILTHYIAGELQEKTTQGRRTITPNRYRRLYIPLRIAHQWNKNRSSFQLGLGANLDVYAVYSGAALDFNNIRTKDSNRIKEIYNNKLALSELSLDFTYGYALNEHLDLNIGMVYVHGLKNHLNHAAYELKYGHLGLRLGLGYRF